MPKIKITMEMDVSDDEQSNFLARLTGNLGNTVSNLAVNDQSVATEDDDGPVNANAPAVDKNGIPWNAEYHSASKAQNADGTWRAKRGVNKEALAAWETKVKAEPPTMTLPSSITGGAPVSLPNPDAPQAAALPGMPVAAALPGFPAPQAAQPDIPVTFETVTAAFDKLGKAGLIAPDGSNIVGIYAEIGCTSLDQLSTDETLRRNLMNVLKQRFPTAGL
jgi:hypothetical protein